MTIIELINLLKKFPENTEVETVFDGNYTNDIYDVWLSNDNIVLLGNKEGYDEYNKN